MALAELYRIPASRAASVDDLSPYEIAVGGLVLEERQRALQMEAQDRQTRIQNANPGPLQQPVDLPEWQGIGLPPKRMDS